MINQDLNTTTLALDPMLHTGGHVRTQWFSTLAGHHTLTRGFSKTQVPESHNLLKKNHWTWDPGTLVLKNVFLEYNEGLGLDPCFVGPSITEHGPSDKELVHLEGRSSAI